MKLANEKLIFYMQKLNAPEWIFDENKELDIKEYRQRICMWMYMCYQNVVLEKATPEMQRLVLIDTLRKWLLNMVKFGLRNICIGVIDCIYYT